MMQEAHSKPKLIIIGASGHGKVIADIARLNGYEEIVFLDDNDQLRECGSFPVVGCTDLVASMQGELFVAVGNSKIRKALMETFSDRVFPVLVHPNAVVAKDSLVGCGSVIMAGAVINPDAKIGCGAIINTCSSVDHDCIVGDYVHVSVGSHLCGTVCVGDCSWIGAGAIVSNNINICPECMIGAGAVVVCDLDIPGTYIGIPAKLR